MNNKILVGTHIMDDKLQRILNLIAKLQDSGIGDHGRLSYIKNAIESGKTIYECDKQYLQEKYEQLKGIESKPQNVLVQESVQTDTKLSEKVDLSKDQTITEKKSQDTILKMPQKHKNEKIAIVLSAIFGLFGFQGLGHIYAGNVTKGIGILLLSLVLLIAGVGTLVVGLTFIEQIPSIPGIEQLKELVPVKTLKEIEPLNRIYLYADPTTAMAVLLGGLLIIVGDFVLYGWQISDSRNLCRRHTEAFYLHKKRKSYYDLIAITCGIFFVVFLIAYLASSALSMIAVAVTVAIIFFQIFSTRRQISSKKKEMGTAPSFFVITMIFLPLALGIVVGFEGYSIWQSPTRLFILWGLTMTFWNTMIFIPTAIYAKYKEDKIPDPVHYPSVTIFVPAYNEEKVIARTIEGLIATDYPKKEIIVIDDGSKDKTLQIANKYKSYAKILHKENGGKASALNYGMAFANGEIAVIVDADTIIGRDAIKQLVKGFVDKDTVAVAGNIKVRNRVNWLTKCQALEYIAGIQINRRAFDFLGSITIVPGALGAFRKSVLEEAGTYDKGTIVEDFDATVKVLKAGGVIKSSNTATAYTEAPQALHDFQKQRRRWYHGNIQVVLRHSDALTNKRFVFLNKIALPYTILSMFVLPVAGLVVIANAIIGILTGDAIFVIVSFALFILLSHLQSALAIRIDGDDPKLIAYSTFMVIIYKQITDFLLLKAAIDVLVKRKAVWTSAKRIGM